MNGRHGFTLIEVLIVVVIMAVLAAVLIPGLTGSARDSRESSLKFDLSALRHQIELYRAHHLGTVPDGTNNLEHLTKATDAQGNVSPTGDPDANHGLGPYVLKEMPPQPFSGNNTVRIDSGTGTPSGAAAPGAGWIYRPATGEIWADHASYVGW